MNKFIHGIVAVLLVATASYGVESLSVQQMFQNSPKETAPQGSTRIVTVRGSTVRTFSLTSTAKLVPAATTTTPGTIIVGTGLAIDPVTGKLNNTGIAGVASWKGRGGAVTPQFGDYSISQIKSAATVAKTGAYADLTGKPTIPAAQVNSDWNASTGVAQVLNKPTVPTALSQLTTDSTHRTVTDAEKTTWNTVTASVNSVNGQTGSVTLVATDVGADPLGSSTSVQTNLTAHTARTDNPHGVTKTQLGLGSVDNTADAAKPVSTEQQTALNLKLNASAFANYTTNDRLTKAEAGTAAYKNMPGNIYYKSLTSDADPAGFTNNDIIISRDGNSTSALDLKANLHQPTFDDFVAAKEYRTTTADGLRGIQCYNSSAMTTTSFTAADAGTFCWDGTLGKMRVWNGSALSDLGGSGGSWGSVGGTLSAQTDLWNKFQTYLLTADHNAYVAAAQVKFSNMSATINSLRIAVVSGGTYTPPTGGGVGGSCSSGTVNVSHMSGSGGDALTSPTTTLGQSFQVASNGTVYSIKVSTGLSGAGGPVKLRWGNTADLRTTYYDEVSVNVTGDGQTLEFVVPSHTAVTTGTQYYWAVSTGSGFSGTLYVGKESGDGYAYGAGYADTVLWYLTTTYGDDKKFEVYLCN